MSFPPVLLKFITATLASTRTAGFRVRHNKKDPAPFGEPAAGEAGPACTGKVDFLYTFGAPGASKPPMKHPGTPTGCFPGKRFYSTSHGTGVFGWDEVDLVAPIAEIAGYGHAWMDVVELEYSEGKEIPHACSEDHIWGPPGVKRFYLHSRSNYAVRVTEIGALDQVLADFALLVSYERDEQVAADQVALYGWGLVHTAFHPGNIVGGPQVAHLMQHPDSLECVLTFQGTDSPQDLLADVYAFGVDFCGIDGKVHRGFRDQMRKIVTSDIFQINIRPFLPHCETVTVAGHSLGGAMAELFTGCMASAPQPGTPGWESDFQYMQWNNDTKSQRLPYIREIP